MDSHLVQEGIYYERGVRPPAFYMLLLLDTPGQMDVERVQAFLADLWKLYRTLKRGMVPDLAPTVVPSGNLGVLIGFGHRALEAGVVKPPPAAHGWGWYRFADPEDHGGGPIYADDSGKSGIRYSRDVSGNAGNAAV